MPQQASIAGEITKDYLLKFPDIPSLTLSRLIYAENKEVFNTIDTARSSVRYYRGKTGKQNRKILKDKRFVKKETAPYNPFKDLPEGMTYYDDWTPYEIKGERVLTIADLHCPFHNRKAIETALEYGVRKKADTVLILGDLIDNHSLSFWEKDPRTRNIKHEIETTQQILSVIRSAFPEAKIIIKTGNHDERLERYLNVKAPELLGHPALTYEEQFQTQRFDIDIVPDKRLIKISDLNMIHGHEFGRQLFSPVNPARGLYLRGKETAMCAHHHRTSEHAEKSMNDNVTVCWSVGCLCDLRPKYATFNSWNHGCAMVYRQGEQFFVKNRKIIDGQIY